MSARPKQTVKWSDSNEHCRLGQTVTRDGHRRGPIWAQPWSVALAAVACAVLGFQGHVFGEADSFGTGDGSDGALTVSAANTTINTYTSLGANVSAGSSTISVGSTSGFAVGGLLMVWQTQKVVSATLGDQTAVDLSSLGVARYELARVQSIGSGSLTLTNPLVFPFESAGAQVIRVPEYSSVTINSSGSITAPAWNGSTGGIVVALVSGAVTNNGSVDVDGLGFRGGAVSGNTEATGCTNYTEASTSAGGRGEGLSRNDYGGSNDYGYGNALNGGGGANCKNAGGGGGGHGARGGDGDTTFDGDGTRDVGGRGGAPVDYDAGAFIVLGGGGGGGERNSTPTPVTGAGGAGGGAIFVRASSFSGTGTYSASGDPGELGISDGSGGGGAGGYLGLLANGTLSCGSAAADGGDGGDVNQGTGNDGVGAGGSGGYVQSSSTGGTCTASADGGVQGTPASGTADGEDGSTGEPAAECGDGTVDAGEWCDDGNTVNGDGCSNICTLDGVILAVRLRSFAVEHHTDGVVLRWSTGFEADNLGFHVYREGAGGRVRLTRQLIAGSALMVATRHLAAGRSYLLVDRGTAPADGRYVLEAVDLNGTTDRFVPTATRHVGRPLPSGLRASAGLSELPRNVGTSVGSRTLALGSPDTPELGHQAGTRAAVACGPGVASSGALARQWQLAADGQAVKLHVDRSGWYRVDRKALQSASSEALLTSEGLTLYRDGSQVALRLIGEQGQREALEFYASALDTAWTGHAVYWLTTQPVDGADPLRIADAPTLEGAAATGARFRDAVTHREHSLYVAAARNGAADNFYGPVITAEGVEQTVPLTAVDDAEGDAAIELALFGLTHADHQIAVTLNDKPVATVAFSGRVAHTTTLAVPQRLLREGNNRLHLQALAGELDTSVIRSVRIELWRRYQATAGRLAFRLSGQREVEVSGFDEPTVELLDVADPRRPSLVRAATQPAAPDRTLRLALASRGTHLMLAVPKKDRLLPARIERNRPSRWNASSNQAGLAIVSHPLFEEAAHELGSHRAAQGWSVAVALVDDLYDEFSFGHKDPTAIRCFAEQAQAKWRRYPTHLLLFGDASIDPRNHLGLGRYDFVPTLLASDSQLETAADRLFVNFASGGRHVVGRLPVRTVDQAVALVDKVQAYDRIADDVPWARNVHLVADVDIEGALDFRAAQRTLGKRISAPWRVVHIDVGDQGAGTARKGLVEAFRDSVMIDYHGHGSVEVWSGGDLFDGAVAQGLTNGSRLPFVAGLTCLNGFFHDLYTESLAEQLLLNPRGGAIAVLASSSLDWAPAHQSLNRRLVERLFSGETLTLGQATAEALQRGRSPHWHLIGDPSQRLKGLHAPLDAKGRAVQHGVARAQDPPLADPSEGPGTTGSPPVEQPRSKGCSTGAVHTQGGVPALLLIGAIMVGRRRRRRTR